MSVNERPPTGDELVALYTKIAATVKRIEDRLERLETSLKAASVNDWLLELAGR
jgi:hypothetical protein